MLVRGRTLVSVILFVFLGGQLTGAPPENYPKVPFLPSSSQHQNKGNGNGNGNGNGKRRPEPAVGSESPRIIAPGGGEVEEEKKPYERSRKVRPIEIFPPDRERPLFEQSDWEAVGDNSHIISNMRDFPPPVAMFLDGLIGIARIKPPPGVTARPSRERQYTRDAQVRMFVSLIGTILDIYSFPRETYKGQVASLADYHLLTRGHLGTSGSHRQDWEDLQRIMNSQEVSPAMEVPFPKTLSDKGSFVDLSLRTQAAMLDLRAGDHLASMVAEVARQQTGHSTQNSFMRIVFDALGHFMVRSPSNIADSLRLFVNLSDQASAMEDERLFTANSPRKAILETADLLDAISRPKIHEKRFLEGLEFLSKQDLNRIIPIIEAFEDALNRMYREFLAVGDRLAESKELRFVKQNNERFFRTLQTLFNRYPRELPAFVFKNIAAKLIRMPLVMSDFEVFQIMAMDFDPLFLTLLQQSSHKVDGSLREIFRAIQQSARAPLPPHIVEMILKRDPSGFLEKGLYGLRVGGIGKNFCTYQGRLGGNEVAVRIRNPETPVMLNVGIDAVPELAGPMGEIFYPDVRDEARRTYLMQRFLEGFTRRVSLEGDVYLTAERQRELGAAMSREETVTTPSGAEITVKVSVAKPEPLERGTPERPNEVMVYPWADGVISSDEFKRKANADTKYANLYVTLKSAFRALIFDPLYGGSPSQEPVAYGLGHEDLHAGNGLFLGLNHQRLLDFGRTTRLEKAQMENLLLLAFGARYGIEEIIVEALWELKSETTFKRKEIANVVWERAQSVRDSRSYWGPADWLTHLYMKGYLNFPDELIGLDGGNKALQNWGSEGIGVTEVEYYRVLDVVIADLTKEYGKQVRSLITRRFPLLKGSYLPWNQNWRTVYGSYMWRVGVTEFYPGRGCSALLKLVGVKPPKLPDPFD